MIDRAERYGDLQTAVRAAIDSNLADTWTSLIGIIQSFNPVQQTCTVLPAIQAQVSNQDGSTSWVTLPLLLDCPVFFPSGGGITLTFPVNAGDECLVVFADRCIDAWWQKGGVRYQADLRMHDLSDGCAYVGFSSLPRVIGGISTTAAALRDTPGTTKVEVTQGGVVNIAAAGAVNITAANVNVTATAAVVVSAPAVTVTSPALTLNSPALTLAGAAINFNGGVSINGKPYVNHAHTNVQNGPNTSGGVSNP